MRLLLAFFLLFIFTIPLHAEEPNPPASTSSTSIESTPKNPPKLESQKRVLTRYEYIDRSHTYGEIGEHLAIAYGGMVGGYLLTQYDTIKENGSWKNYGNNIGNLSNDKDNPIWNLVGHPYTGSQTFLFYRALGYERLHSMHMAFWTSFLFETTIEIYTEKASVQDLYQTPILGSALGYGFERLSLFLLNNDNSTIFKVVGHIINPMTFFGFTEVQTTIYPEISKNRQGLFLLVSF
ncbi:MAG: DUF3943 domain-containing protein [Bacteriovoracaceae bacterium]